MAVGSISQKNGARLNGKAVEKVVTEDVKQRVDVSLSDAFSNRVMVGCEASRAPVTGRPTVVLRAQDMRLRTWIVDRTRHGT